MSDQNPDTVPPVEGVDPAEVHVIDLNDTMTPPPEPVAAEAPLPDVLSVREKFEAIGWVHEDSIAEIAHIDPDANVHISYSLLDHLPNVPNVMENQCHAYNKNGQRCEHMAGHPGWHEVSFEWDDDSCWVPGTPSPLMQMSQQVAAMSDPTSALDVRSPSDPDTPMSATEPVVDHVTKEGIPVVYSTDVPDRLEVPDPNDPCVACEGCRRAHHPGGGKCARCGTCVRYVG